MDEQKIQITRRDNEEASTKRRSVILGINYLDVREIENTLPLINDIFSVDEMYKNHIVPLVKGDEGRIYEFAVTAAAPQPLMAGMQKDYSDRGMRVVFYLISESGFKAFMRRYDPPKHIIPDDIKIAREGDSDTLAEVSQTLNSVNSEQMFDYLIEQADKLNASDIHIENQRDHIRIRMRVDGALHPVADLDRDRYRIIMGELASRAGVSAAASQSQSGHMQRDITRDGATFLLNLRVETVPTMYGTDAVLRLFNFDESLLNLDLLGIPDAQRKQIDEVISHPRGLVLMVGPTGSGKSTTLYSILNALNTPDRKLITLEDPIEYGLSGISQIAIDTTGGRNFADGLRSVLRLDPDVVMVGEIRDQDTAKTAIQASITGHLVLSSFHANSTSAAFSRMIDMIGINPIFSTAIRLLIAQRLVRRLWDESKEQYEPDEKTKNYIRETLRGAPDYVEIPDLENIRLYRPVPTDEVPFGYKGRVVIMEMLVMNEEIQKFIRGDVLDVHTETIEKVAKENGMLTLEQVGVLAALRGETTLDEISRVI